MSRDVDAALLAQVLGPSGFSWTAAPFLPYRRGSPAAEVRRCVVAERRASKDSNNKASSMYPAHAPRQNVTVVIHTVPSSSVGVPGLPRASTKRCGRVGDVVRDGYVGGVLSSEDVRVALAEAVGDVDRCAAHLRAAGVEVDVLDAVDEIARVSDTAVVDDSRRGRSGRHAAEV